ncbi:hypothetical protein [Acidithiobacillus thiooxidans]|uniref:Uncharacterized protein n=1 Tax=Acidithiobacillus thiooxidans ATCC 19377 TaxID=637390 RepID=A0A543Q2C9_ACITH|nr:hypothetical protein [Acidithiobacillus thiooxidans]MDX5935415.1 hypothetical protein [Acidithiobacillus thiooxidans]TQN50448.1 hypothetical protein DLNHIDIE_00301 [Acidithiobacillus thiooxidans ATCC 19377]
MNTSFHIESHSMQLRSAILLYGNGGHVDYATQHPYVLEPVGMYWYPSADPRSEAR